MIKVNKELVKVTTFPNGESLIRKGGIKSGEENLVSMRFESDKDLIHLMMIKEEIDNQGGTAILQLPYVPYSRMDRTEGMNVFTLKSVCNLINRLNFKEVRILEPHSDVCVALLDRVVVFNMTAQILSSVLADMEVSNDDYIVFPDGGAEKRYSKQIQSENVLTAIKHRDFSTGEIKSLEIVGDTPKKGFNAVILDDLCSKGGTFLFTAQKLKEMGANKIYLIVTHCENTILQGVLLKEDSPIEKIYTTNSIFDETVFDMASQQFKMVYGKTVDLNKLSIKEVF